jgi:hypothetical protein
MKLIRQLNLIAFVTLLALTVSCNNNSKEKHCDVFSYEFNLKGDTVNLIDCNGKQGIWIPNHLNKLQDTVYYKNDSIINQ